MSGGTKVVIVCGVLLVSAIMSGWMLPSRALEGHECFVTVVAREMLESGDWVVPTYNGEPRLQKTPLNYWLVAISSAIRGGTDELAGRLPSVLLAVVSTGAILLFVSQWSGFRAAVLAGLIWSTSFGFIRYGRSARPEMSLTCFVAIAMMSFYSGATASNRRKQIICMGVFWISLGLAMLAKGPAPLPLVGVPLFLYIAAGRRWKLIGKVLPVMGTIVFLAIVLPWPILVVDRLAEAAGESATLDFWKAEFVGRFMGTHDSGGKPVYYYLPYMFEFMLPWAAFVVMAMAAPFYKVWGEKRRVMFYLWLWFIGDIAIMSASGGKRMHYVFPAMPAMAILAGIILEDVIFTRCAYTARFARNLLLAHAGAAIVAAVGLAWYALSRPTALQPGVVVVLSLGGIVLTAIVVWLFWRGKSAGAVGAMFAGTCVLFMAAGAAGLFSVDTSFNRNAEVFARRVADATGGDADLIAYREVSSRFVHHYGKKVAVEQDMGRVHDYYMEGRWIVATGLSMAKLIEDGRFEIEQQWTEAEREGEKVVDGAVFGKVDK